MPGNKSIFSVADHPTITRVPVPVDTRAPNSETNAYLVGVVLIDPPAQTARLDEAVTAHAVEHIAVTHYHPDHVGGVQYYAAETNAQVWATQGRTAAFTDATGVKPDAVASAGTAIGPVTVLETPGHAPEHLTFRLDQRAVVGDLAVADGSVYIGSVEGDMRAYLTALRRLRAMGFEQLFPGHGPVIEDANRVLERLITHRQMRERRVLEAVRRGATSPEAIVDAAYEKDLEGVYDLAVDAVKAHLEKLRVERKVSWDGQSVVASDF